MKQRRGVKIASEFAHAMCAGMASRNSTGTGFHDPMKREKNRKDRRDRKAEARAIKTLYR